MKIITDYNVGTLIAGVLLTSMASLPAAVMVDQFTSPSGGQGISISNGSLGSTQHDVRTGLPAVLGGSRELMLQLQAIYDPSNYCAATVNGFTSANQFALANGPNVDSLFRLIWDANGSGLNTNLSADYEFDMLNVHSEIPVAYTLAMQTFGGGVSSQTVNTGTNFAGSLRFPFSGFSAGANLTDIDRISLTIESGRSADVSMGALVTVPEPASAGLALLGGLALLARRRRVQQD